MSRVKIIATIGPMTANANSLKELQQAGMDIARLNGSHADFDWHSDAIKLIRHAVPGVPILLDLPGNKIRATGVTEELPMAALERVVLTSETKNSTEGRVMVNFQDLPQHVSVGDNIVMGDGGFALIVDDITDELARLELHGIKPVAKAIGDFFKTAKLRDPDGNLIILSQPQQGTY